MTEEEDAYWCGRLTDANKILYGWAGRCDPALLGALLVAMTIERDGSNTRSYLDDCSDTLSVIQRNTY
jgi:hypothetical protein